MATKTADVAELRDHLAKLEAEVRTIDAEITKLSRDRDRLVAERATSNGDLVRGWKLDEQIAAVGAKIAVQLDAKRQPAERLAAISAVLQPVDRREREVKQRSAAAAGCEQLLEVAALLDRIPAMLAAVDSARRQSGGHLGFDATARKLDTVVDHWHEVVAAQARQQLADHRRFVRGGA